MILEETNNRVKQTLPKYPCTPGRSASTNTYIIYVYSFGIYYKIGVQNDQECDLKELKRPVSFNLNFVNVSFSIFFGNGINYSSFPANVVAPPREGYVGEPSTKFSC